MSRFIHCCLTSWESLRLLSFVSRVENVRLLLRRLQRRHEPVKLRNVLRVSALLQVLLLLLVLSLESDPVRLVLLTCRNLLCKYVILPLAPLLQVPSPRIKQVAIDFPSFARLRPELVHPYHILHFHLLLRYLLLRLGQSRVHRVTSQHNWGTVLLLLLLVRRERQLRRGIGEGLGSGRRRRVDRRPSLRFEIEELVLEQTQSRAHMLCLGCEQHHVGVVGVFLAHRSPRSRTRTSFLYPPLFLHWSSLPPRQQVLIFALKRRLHDLHELFGVYVIFTGVTIAPSFFLLIYLIIFAFLIFLGYHLVHAFQFALVEEIPPVELLQRPPARLIRPPGTHRHLGTQFLLPRLMRHHLP